MLNSTELVDYYLDSNAIVKTLRINKMMCYSLYILIYSKQWKVVSAIAGNMGEIITTVNN
jgi:hypothetical protein